MWRSSAVVSRVAVVGTVATDEGGVGRFSGASAVVIGVEVAVCVCGCVSSLCRFTGGSLFPLFPSTQMPP